MSEKKVDAIKLFRIINENWDQREIWVQLKFENTKQKDQEPFQV